MVSIQMEERQEDLLSQIRIKSLQIYRANHDVLPLHKLCLCLVLHPSLTVDEAAALRNLSRKYNSHCFNDTICGSKTRSSSNQDTDYFYVISSDNQKEAVREMKLNPSLKIALLCKGPVEEWKDSNFSLVCSDASELQDYVHRHKEKFTRNK